MTLDRAALAAYLRQRASFGENELYLEGITAHEAVQMLKGAVVHLSTSAVADRGSRIEIAEPTVRSSKSETRTEQPRSVIPDPRSQSALTVLQTEAHACTACRLNDGRTTVVFGEGNPNADVMVVGEAPGQEEDRSGRPFVGQAGKLLDLLLQATGFPRESVYICNTLKCRPPNNRNPLPDEMESCSRFLLGQMDAIRPKALIAVGKFAAQALLNSEESIGRLRGQIHSFRGTPLIVTYHPAYLLRSMQASRTAWHDFQLLRRVIDEQA